ncbi:MAG: NADH-quinone oxidoreductase subunit NuoF [Dehalococcoidia bacterium]|nr:NADH-quinone oxidoreductase subunit NuoF [Dehalococcoidia bacterium]MDZ4245523.1 NADH-quinone oxidoreductase subunit NuoF [Dehalococcoidia bacterium]
MRQKLNSIKDLQSLREQILKDTETTKPTIAVCCGTGCQAYGSNHVYEAFKEEIKKQGAENKIDARATGCHGFCERGPLTVIYPEKVFYQRVKTTDVEEIVSSMRNESGSVNRLLYTDSKTKQPIFHEDKIPFYEKQQRIIFGQNGYIDPTSIEDYIALGGYQSLAKALASMTPEQVVDEVTRSGLRGRGGGGFPTGAKWQSTKKVKVSPKYIICNADEGDPGAYMDRSLVEGNPHSVIEGMLIGAFAIGSGEGFIYVRHEYPLAVKNLKIALEQARELGLLGKNILGSKLKFDIQINRGGGAYICGETTALIASLEGRVGEPRDKYIHTAENGLHGKPTVINNVETWANIPLIINRGADWYNTIGTEKSKGTKIFSLVGKINNTGLVEVPMGITLKEIIYDIGGGIPKNKKFKAVQTGGPSGGCLPENLLDMPVDFDALTEAGSMMGSGGMIVMDETTCMVDVAKYFLSFLEQENCGKCVPCREGIKRMREIVEDITEGRGKEGDIEWIQEMSSAIIDGSLCALGGTAPNPVLSSIRYFRDEWDAHIKHKKCPAGVCKSMILYSIIDANCPGCGLCVKECPTKAITFKGKRNPVILDQSKCIKCRACLESCKLNAIEVR